MNTNRTDHRNLTLLVLGIAALLRIWRAGLRWDEISWLYAAYPGATVDALIEGRLWTAATSFTGLHPPLWSLLHATSEILFPIPALWLIGSALASWGAVYLVSRESIWAGALLATAPVQLHYAAEVNNYPLATLWIALAWTGHRKAKQTGNWSLIALAGVLAGWTHVLAGLAVAATALTLPKRLSLKILGTMFLTATPLLFEVGSVIEDGDGPTQPAFVVDLVVMDFLERFGPWFLLSLPAFYVGARTRPELIATWLATGLLLVGLVAARIAAPHQFPYMLFLGVPTALILAATADVPWARRWITALVLGQLCWAIYGEGSRTLALTNSETGAIDRALSEMDTPWTCGSNQAPTPECTGDAIVLLAPGGFDDDKRGTSSVLWRLSPWESMPRVVPYRTTDDQGVPVPFDHQDFRHGQPRLYRGFVVYVHDEPRPTLELIRNAHERVRIVVYEHGRREAFGPGLVRRLGVEPTSFDNDLIFRLP